MANEALDVMRDHERRRTQALRWLAVFGLACLYTLLNSCKPLVIDDAAYYYFARQMASQPLDPYGFETFWYEVPQPAQEVLAPPVLPYWWALGLRLFGQQPFLWKLWLLPFSLVLVGSLFRLAHRFARGAEWPIVLVTVLSPAFLPSLNLMLDVPALALALCALTLFLDEPGGWGRAILSGIVLGLAAQTKYTSFVVLAAVLARSVMSRQALRGVVTSVVSLLLFVVWEAVMAAKYGESHFLYAARSDRASIPVWMESKALLIWPLLTILGAVAPCVGLLGLASLSRSGRVLLAAAAVLLLGYVAVAMVPEGYSAWIESREGSPWRVHLDDVVYGTAGLVLFTILGAACWRLWGTRVRRREARFLVLWLGLELAGTFMLTPFPAVRRVLGLVVVITLIVGRLASLRCRAESSRRQVWAVVAGNLLLGLLFWSVDLVGALAHQQAAEAVRRRSDVKESAGQVWFVGHWGFQFYAERAGMAPVVPSASRLQRGDWLAVPDKRHVHQQRIVLQPDHLELVEECKISDALPLRTVACYYGGHIPLERQEGPRVLVRLYRVKVDHIAAWQPAAR